MIIHTKGMREIEQNSGYSNEELMEKAGQALAEAIIPHLDKEKKILILCGKGNNGGDGFVLARILKDYCISIVTPDGKPSSKEALSAYSKVPRRMKKPMKNADALIEESDIIIDAIYGFSYHGKLKDNIRSLCQKVNAAKACVYSIASMKMPSVLTSPLPYAAINHSICYAKTIIFLQKQKCCLYISPCIAMTSIRK